MTPNMGANVYRIASIEIQGFRNSENPLSIPLDGTVNFFIGRNGTGKTTLMNLLNAALSADMVALSDAEFYSVVFKLKKDGDRKRPYIKVQRGVDDDGDPTIDFTIAKGARSGIKKHSVFLTSPQHFWQRSPGSLQSRHHLQDVWGNVDAIRRDIRELISLSWISVHRSVTKSKPRWEESVLDVDQEFESPVDRKLHQVAQEFGAYFSTLDKLAAAETDKFQKIYLLSLISPSKIESISSVNDINIDDEKAAITGMFAEFNIKTSAYSAKLDSFIKRMSSAISNYKPHAAIDGRDFLVLTDTVRIHDAARNWHALLDKRREIYSPKKKFIDTINGLFFKKTIEINSGNQPIFRVRTHWS